MPACHGRAAGVTREEFSTLDSCWYGFFGWFLGSSAAIKAYPRRGGCRLASLRRRAVHAGPWPWSTSRVFAPRRRGRDGGASSRAAADRAIAAAAGGRWSTRTDPPRAPPPSRPAGRRRSPPRDDSWSAPPFAP